LPAPDVALQQPLHRPGALHIRDDLGERVALPFRQLERQHGARRLANAIVNFRHQPCDLRVLVRRSASPSEDEEVLEDQPRAPAS
jgi:hypothetical protein